jgi:peptidoglycan/xylan/chitin deacetylase (PgdA/CDA1 family)
LVISLDFELHWGVRDIRPVSQHEGKRLMIARAALPRILDLFEQYGIHATWATVGYLFAHSRDELRAFSPRLHPSYRDRRLQSYCENIGNNEREDPLHFAPSLIDEIGRRAGQEIASHSFSHYYCMEEGQSAEEFEADLQSALAIAANAGYKLRSYVFPRNQSNPAYLPCLRRVGICSYRGNEPSSTKRAASFAEQRRPHLRLARLIDSYTNFDGFQTFPWPQHPPLLSVPASRYLRPYHPIADPFQDLLLERIHGAIRHAAESGELFHLWWHPEDFSPYCAQNLAMLRRVLELFQRYRQEYGMESLSMSEVVDRTAQSSNLEVHHDVA